MKKITFLFIFLIFTLCSYANGVIIVDEVPDTYLRLTNTNVDVTVQNQVAVTVTSQVFVNELGGSYNIRYAFPMASEASYTQLRWRINGGEWLYAVFVPGDPGDPGSGVDIPDYLANYLGETPVFFPFDDPIEDGDVLEVELSYVELLPYSFNEVTFSYPSDYSAIQPGIIENFQTFNLELISDRTIENIVMVNNNGTIVNNGNLATVFLEVEESAPIDDIHIIYELASDELGVIPFSTLLEPGTITCDELGDGFFGLVIEPESNVDTEVIDKNFILVVDRSGSMSGDKIVQARQAAEFITNNLNFGDFFNIVDFSSGVSSFSPELMEYNTANRDAALAYIDNISAGGTTNISDSLIFSINQFDSLDLDKANIIVFFTDGQATAGITDTEGILQAVETEVQNNETEIFLFTFGIGESVTQDLLTRLALENNGFVTFLGDDEISDVISNFYLTIRNPVLLNPVVTITPPDAINDFYPNPLPNLYKGQQLIWTGRYNTSQDINLNLAGSAFNQPVEYSFDFNLTDLNDPNFAFLPKLWAKKKIESLLLEYYSWPQGSTQAEEILDLIEETSICYQVSSPFTILSDGGTLFLESDLEGDLPSAGFHPNPFTTSTKAYIELSQPEKIVVEIYSIDGKLIKTIEIDGTYGRNSIEWDGTDNGNNEVNKGLYVYSVSIGKQKKYAGKILRI
ncbi:VWA domain-containing protein [Aureisphaera galaxeae]|uniref:VWA domain-containing protein n=1 Tax=Aureisphaera galaxeae TaxID=1538023 RepID=UPI002350F81D|nr:VWA domain-containing protein [Aureisphaera galaxeae]MDC8004626.1 VWA domain-containing protein [Aureisphaera galaxeae]